jgi:hypothetical protein
MTLKNSSLRFIACAVLGLFGVGSLLAFYLNYEKTGTATSLQTLPQYGELFRTNIPAFDLHYTYNPSSRSLLVAGRISKAHFTDLCKVLGVDFVGYPEGGWPRSGDVPEKYLPTNKLVYAGEGKAYSEGRAIIHLYYSPESRQEQEGDLFIHIW